MFVVRRGAVVAASRCLGAALPAGVEGPDGRRANVPDGGHLQGVRKLRNVWDGGRLLSARDEAPPVSAARAAGASAEARRQAFEALAPQKSARQGLVTLGAFWDRARLLAGAGRSCRAQAAGEVLAEGRRLLHSHLRRVRAVHSLQKSGFSCSGGASMSMSINRPGRNLIGLRMGGRRNADGNPQGNCAPRKRRRRGHTGNGVAGDGR